MDLFQVYNMKIKSIYALESQYHLRTHFPILPTLAKMGEIRSKIFETVPY